MGIFNYTHQIIRFRDGITWYFYYVKNKGIYYKELNNKGSWADAIELIRNTCEDFSIKLDENDHLHLIYSLKTGEIMYMYYNGNNWARQILSKYEPIRHIIKYPTILLHNENIHIIFALGATFNTGYWSLYHYRWNGEKWGALRITSMTAGTRLSRFILAQTEKHIHLVYKGLGTKKYDIYYCHYSMDYNIWSSPENITHSEADCNSPSILAIADRLHFIWTTLEGNNLVIKYKFKSLNFQNKNWDNEIILSSAGANCFYPQLIQLQEKVWCIWVQGDSLYGCISDNFGQSWGSALKIDYNSKDLWLIKYETNYPQEIGKFSFPYIFANIQNTLSLPIIDGHIKLTQSNILKTNIEKSLEIEKEAKEKSKKEIKNLETHRVNKYKHAEGKNELYTINDIRKQIEEDIVKSVSSLPNSNRINTPSDTQKVGSIQNECKQTSNLHNASRKTDNMKSNLLNGMKKQDELVNIILYKLEEQSKYNEELKEELNKIKGLLNNNNKMLQMLILAMEHLNGEIQRPKARGFINKLFNR